MLLGVLCQAGWTDVALYTLHSVSCILEVTCCVLHKYLVITCRFRPDKINFLSLVKRRQSLKRRNENKRIQPSTII